MKAAKKSFQKFRTKANIGRRMLTEQSPQTLNSPLRIEEPIRAPGEGGTTRGRVSEELNKRKLGRNRATIMQDRMGA